MVRGILRYTNNAGESANNMLVGMKKARPWFLNGYHTKGLHFSTTTLLGISLAINRKRDNISACRDSIERISCGLLFVAGERNKGSSGKGKFHPVATTVFMNRA